MGLDIVIVMIIVWSVVIAVALMIEFFVNCFVSAWFAAGGLAALISAPTGLDWYWQILIFFGVSFLFLLGMRPFVKRFIKTKTEPTNLDQNIGKTFKLLKDCVEGISEIQINDIIWKVSCPDGLKANQQVEIVGMQGNKYVVDVKKKGETK